MNGLMSGFAGAVCALAVGCGGGDVILTGQGDAGYMRADANVSTPPGSGITGSGGGVIEAGAADGSASASSSGATSSGEAGTTTGGSSSGSSSGGSTEPVCAPGNACGGLTNCDDECFTDKCCVLVCQCTDSSGQTGNLSCVMNC